MSPYSKNAAWIVEAGHAIVLKKASAAELTPWETLIYCLWVADYAMCNAGDLDTAEDVYPDFQKEAARIAGDLSLDFTTKTFTLTKEALEQEYFGRRDRICEEIKGFLDASRNLNATR